MICVKPGKASVASMRKNDSRRSCTQVSRLSVVRSGIMYVCTPCRNEGSLSKRLMKCELECARMNEQRLASERLLEERQCRIKNFKLANK